MKTDNRILISIPVYRNDTPSYVEKSISSIVCQLKENDKLIIQVDGFINDDLNKSILKYLDYKNISIFFYKINRGLPSVLNEAIQYFIDNNFTYFARMDADDISMPDRLEKQYLFLENNKDIDVVGGAIEEIDEFSNSRGKIVYYPLSHNECLKFFKQRDPIAHPTAFFRKSYFEKAGIYNETYKKNQDTILWYNGFKNNCKFANLDEVILKYRITNDFFVNRRSGWNRATNFLKDGFFINYNLGFGILSYLYAFIFFILTISPTFLKKIAYKYLR